MAHLLRMEGQGLAPDHQRRIEGDTSLPSFPALSSFPVADAQRSPPQVACVGGPGSPWPAVQRHSLPEAPPRMVVPARWIYTAFFNGEPLITRSAKSRWDEAADPALDVAA